MADDKQRKAVKILAEEVAHSIRTIIDERNRANSDTPVASAKAALSANRARSAENLTGKIESNQVTGLYNAVATYLSRAIDDAISGDAVAQAIVDAVTDIIFTYFTPVNDAQIDGLFEEEEVEE